MKLYTNINPGILPIIPTQQAPIGSVVAPGGPVGGSGLYANRPATGYLKTVMPFNPYGGSLYVSPTPYQSLAQNQPLSPTTLQTWYQSFEWGPGIHRPYP